MLRSLTIKRTPRKRTKSACSDCFRSFAACRKVRALLFDLDLTDQDFTYGWEKLKRWLLGFNLSSHCDVIVAARIFLAFWFSCSATIDSCGKCSSPTRSSPFLTKASMRGNPVSLS